MCVPWSGKEQSRVEARRSLRAHINSLRILQSRRSLSGTSHGPPQAVRNERGRRCNRWVRNRSVELRLILVKQVKADLRQTTLGGKYAKSSTIDVWKKDKDLPKSRDRKVRTLGDQSICYSCRAKPHPLSGLLSAALSSPAALRQPCLGFPSPQLLAVPS